MSTVQAVVSKEEAIARGRVRYVSRPCKHGHLERYVSDGGHCVECRKEARLAKRARARERSQITRAVAVVLALVALSGCVSWLAARDDRYKPCVSIQCLRDSGVVPWQGPPLPPSRQIAGAAGVE